MLFHVRSTALLALSTCAALTQALPGMRLESRGLSFDYNNQKVRGVNLGGWLVLEPWITPSIFEAGGSSAVDEWTLCANLGHDQALSKLSSHWNSFITASDFKQIASVGMNHVRIPVGYWAVTPIAGEPFVQGQLNILNQAIGWARDAGLKVIVDLHGAPGSQNGFDNSGRRGPIDWQQGYTVNQTLDAFQALSEQYAKDADVVTIIEVLNEPFVPGGVQLDPLKQFYYDSWGRLRTINKDTILMIHDGFQEVDSWNGFMGPNTGFSDVMLDTHNYHVFDNGLLGDNVAQHVQTACTFGKNELAGADKWTVVGEWTGAMTDCAKYLNGRGIGARYDSSYGQGSTYHGSCAPYTQGSVQSLSADDKSNIRHFIEAQLDAFEMRSGWVYWTWTTEGAPEWDMKQQLANGVFPSPVTARQYPGQCG